MIPARVFVSHATKDQASAKLVLRALEAQQLGCWFAPRDIPAGANYQGEIKRAIEHQSGAFLVLLSANANASLDMKKEMSVANASRIPVIPFRIDQTPLDDDWSFELSVRQWIDGSDGIQQALPSLVAQVKSAMTARPCATPATPKPIRRPAAERADSSPGDAIVAKPAIVARYGIVARPERAVSPKLIGILLLAVCIIGGLVGMMLSGEDGPSPTTAVATRPAPAPTQQRTNARPWEAGPRPRTEDPFSAPDPDSAYIDPKTIH